jgi:tubby-related protein 1
MVTFTSYLFLNQSFQSTNITLLARIKNASMDLFNNAAAKIPTVVDQRSDYNTVRAFLSRAPKNGAASLRFYVVRDRQGFNMLNPIFRLFLEDGNQFLLSAQKATNNKTSNYHLSMARTPSGRRDPLTLGKLRANWSGSEYWIYDDGLNPAKTAIEANTRCILGFIEFAYDEMGPGRMNIHIPKVYDNSNISTWRDTDMEGPNRVTAKEEFQQKLDKDAVFLRNKRPVYDEKTGGHVLNFHGRITMPSVKNFQVEYDSSSDEPALQFGRVSCQPPGPRAQCKCHKNTFNMDVCFPLSPLQAFAICLSTLDGKFADQKMYDSVTKFINKKK